MDKVSVFESSDFGELRIIVDPKGDVWFVASDVAKSLGYVNAKDAIKRHVDDDDSIILQVSNNQWGVNQSLLKTRYIDNIRIINESGLYSLILSSKLESAKRFKKWVTSEVLPSIRKTGEYKTSSGGKGILVPDFSNPADAARAWADGTYMEYGHGFLPPYDHYGMHEKMKEMEERENELEERERRLEERERRHEMEDREYRRMGYESYPTDYYGDDRYYGDGPQMRRGRGRGRGRSY